ncbi:hypothetical protein [Streptococcus equi]|uniref:hypothetical protein n=1 Tax=Streptococcus equi TaxID=1336 RepID=UPI0022AB7F1D|nr:hypothetical protein [Streptococcus equi]
MADLEAQLAEKTAELDVVKADKAELEAKVKELQSLLEQKDRSNADLQANIERLKQELLTSLRIRHSLALRLLRHRTQLQSKKQVSQPQNQQASYHQQVKLLQIHFSLLLQLRL